MVLIPSLVVGVLVSRFSTTSEPLGTGTLMALDVSLPVSVGKAFATALPAPVSGDYHI